MIQRTPVAQGVLAALGGALIATSMPVLAQSTERVVVTGSRIKSIDSFSNSPVTSLTAAELNSSQPVAVEDVVKNLAAAVPAIGPGVNNGSGGGATIDLRGLGPRRTLVLIDGRRMVPFDLEARVDTNSIPIALLERVDLVTGGASAVYGADAIAGVVNFVLKKNFTGARADTSYGISEEGDTIRRKIDLTLGASLDGGKGNVTLSLGRTKTDPLRAGDRPIGQTTTSSATGLFSGSGTTLPVVIAVTPVSPLPAGTTNTLGTGNRQLNLATGRFDAFVAATGGFNTNPPNYFQTPLDRTQGTALASYTINENAEVYAQFFYTKSVVNSVLAASGTFGNTYQVPIGNPFIPEAARQQICSARGIAAASCVLGNTTEVPITISRRFVELGPRFNDFENSTNQATVGLRGDLFKGWSYDAYYTSGKADQLQTRRNWGSNSKVQQALRAVTTTACTSTANGCVPLNVFGAEGSITQPMLDFINLNALITTKVKQQVMSASATGDLPFKLPTAKTPISMAFGAEGREVTAANASDGSSQIQAEVLGTGAPTPDRKGTLKLKEGFVEAIVPLAQDLPFARNVRLELGGRYTEFSTTRTTTYNTSKVGGEWEPLKGLRFRGMVQKATRAPNIQELYEPQSTRLGNLATDPCQGTRISAAESNSAGTLSNLCRQTGVPAAVIGNLGAPSSGQINVLSGGNPDLGPEKADTQTLGLVWEPEAVQGLTVSFDRYRINVTDAISTPSTTDVLDGCYSTAFNPTFAFNAACSNIGRDPNNGSFNGAARGVFVGQSNQGKIWIGGIDINANYRLPLKNLGLDPKWGTVDIGFNYNKVLDNDFQATPISVRRNCIGYYSPACGAPNFEQKFNQRTTWTFGNYTVGYNWRHMSAMQVEPGSGTWYEPYASIPSYNYVDLSASWQATKNVRLSLAINNVTDKQPPKVGNTIATTSTNGGETLPSTYDTIGRYYSIAASIKF